MDTQPENPAATEQGISSRSAITGISFVSVYVDDYQTCYPFYADLLGLKKKYDMGANACFFEIGSEWGLYLEGGNDPREITPKSSRSSFTLSVPSAGELYSRLKESGIKMVQAEPMDMGQGDFWFQFYDPSGNILEALGAE